MTYPFSEVDKLIDLATSSQGDGYPFYQDALEMAEMLGLTEELIAGINSYLEKELDTPISIISVGPDRKQTFFR